MPALVPEPGLEAWRLLLKAHAAVVARIETDLQHRGLVPLVWYDVLIAISDAPQGRIRLRDLASELVLTRSSATRLIDRVESAGLVARHRAEDDHRGAVAVLTPAGRRALRAAWPVYAGGIRDLFLSALSTEECAVIGASMARVVSRLGGGDQSAQRTADLAFEP